jgi:hypothetical protein
MNTIELERELEKELERELEKDWEKEWEKEDWEDEWDYVENYEYDYDYDSMEMPELSEVNNKKQQLRLEEKKLMEDAELILTKDLFSGKEKEQQEQEQEQESKVLIEPLNELTKCVKKDKIKELQTLLKNKQNEIKKRIKKDKQNK